VIERFANMVIFLDGWQFSSGCTYEFLRAAQTGLSTVADDGSPLTPDEGRDLIEKAIAEIRTVGASTLFLEGVLSDLSLGTERLSGKSAAHFEQQLPLKKISEIADRNHFKDAVLDQLAAVANIAQFVSFEPNSSLSQRFSRIQGFRPNHRFANSKDAIAALLERSPEGTVNVRSFWPDQTTGEPLAYKLHTVEAVIAVLRERAARKLYTIVNETIDVEDGGVSGVALGNVLEFAPRATPQSVDEPGTCSLPRELGLRLLQQIYGFRPALSYTPTARIEFSIHPRRRGLCSEHTVIWEIQEVHVDTVAPAIYWPNNFSRFIGDKAFGLVLADALDLPIPHTLAITRNLPPFVFGHETGTVETWMRTCPENPTPGKYPTTYGWSDPFAILAKHDEIASVLAQESVQPEFSGSLIPRASLPPMIEGVEGRGDAFMIGRAAPVSLPENVRNSVLDLYSVTADRLGSVELEWVYDGQRTWILQVHVAHSLGSESEIFHGEAEDYERFDVTRGLESLRSLIPELVRSRRGLILVGNVGITSHFGDLLRSARIPSRIERTAPQNSLRLNSRRTNTVSSG
jgi:hypothetical protein